MRPDILTISLGREGVREWEGEGERERKYVCFLHGRKNIN